MFSVFSMFLTFDALNCRCCKLIVKTIYFQSFQGAILLYFILDKFGEDVNHGAGVTALMKRLPRFILDPLGNVELCLGGERPGGLDNGGSLGGVGGVFVGGGMDNHMVRRNTMTRNVRKKGRADDRLIIQMPNIGHNNLKDGVFVGGFSDNLAEVWADVQEVFDVEIIFVSSTDECTARISGF